MNVLERFKKISTFIFDVDGVMTDGSIGIVPGLEYIRTMNTKDGYVLQLAVKQGYRVVVITGGNVPPVVERMNSLGITDVFHHVKNKTEVYNRYVNDHMLNAEETLYMGDDIPDYEIMQYVGLACCPADAVQEIKSISHYISPLPGGKGCVRDVIEKVLKLNGHWELNTEIKSI
ncbi:MAG: HAD hydrolase family protein [Chitinophagaceae bacterium]|nr:HAD hydrolase family protein [Chitinophagaceae bacterium]